MSNTAWCGVLLRLHTVPCLFLFLQLQTLGLFIKLKKKKKISPFPQSSWLPTGMADIKVVLSCGFLIQENDSSN